MSYYPCQDIGRRLRSDIVETAPSFYCCEIHVELAVPEEIQSLIKALVEPGA
jgi:hypothetical protein